MVEVCGVSEKSIYESLSKDLQGSFHEFLKYFWKVINPEAPLVDNWHIKFLCDELQKLAIRVKNKETRKHDLCINISPGSSKSTICSQMFPAWVWTFMPHAQFVCSSFKANHALRDAQKHRDIVTSIHYQELFGDVKLRADSRAKGKFINKNGGFRYSSTTPTGEHGHFIIVDDPLDPSIINSDAEVEETNYWFEEVLPTRKVDKLVTPMILIMQRLRENDPSGNFIKNPKTKHICIPAELSPDVRPKFLRKYYIEGLMDPVRLSREALEEEKSRPSLQMSADAYYAAQFLQNPTSRKLGVFKVDKIQVEPGPFKDIVAKWRYWDKAGTMGGGCLTAGVLLGKDIDGRIWILDCITGQWDSSTREDIIKQAAIADGKGVRIGVEEEGGSGGKESAENTVRNLEGFSVWRDKPSGDKTVRAEPIASQVASGNVWMVKAHWNAEFLRDMRWFPGSAVKDRIDALSGAYKMMTDNTNLRLGSW